MSARRACRHGGGFTLVEIVITVAIVAILASAALPVMELTVRRGKEAELRAALREIRTALDKYRQSVDDGRIARRANEPGYPPSLNALVDGVTDVTSPTKEQIYFLRRLPRDPFAVQPGLSPAETWGKRSYASPPQQPVEGNDVYDVYSLSAETGINGIPYREW